MHVELCRGGVAIQLTVAPPSPATAKLSGGEGVSTRRTLLFPLSEGKASLSIKQVEILCLYHFITSFGEAVH